MYRDAGLIIVSHADRHNTPPTITRKYIDRATDPNQVAVEDMGIVCLARLDDARIYVRRGCEETVGDINAGERDVG